MTHLPTVGIIGAGAGGLITALKLIQEQKFNVVIYEQLEKLGGTWIYDGNPRVHPIPNNPTQDWTSINAESFDIPSAIYPSLKTNLPAKLMEFRAFPFPEDTPMFPPHNLVLAYLESFAASFDLLRYIKFNKFVTAIDKTEDKWEVQYRDLKDNTAGLDKVDYLVVSNGHFTYPRVPTISGLATFGSKILHSQSYRDPNDFKGQRIVIVGGSYSGRDILRETSQVVKEVYLSVRQPADAVIDDTTNVETVKIMPEIAELRPDCSILFTNGYIINNIDAVIFATGYLYRYPFFKLDYEAKITDGLQVLDTFLHLFNVDDPSLAFVGLPRNVVPFHLFEYQAEMLAATWSSRISLPSKEEMRTIERLGGYGGAKDALGPLKHKFGAEREFVYCNALAEMYGGEKVSDHRIQMRTNVWDLRKGFLGY